MNLLLFSCWHARCRGVFDGEVLKNALAFSSTWADNVVRPLRGARTWMKAHEAELWERACPRSDADDPASAAFNVLRQQIKSVELQSERFQQNMLESLVQTPVQTLSTQTSVAAAVQNLRNIVEVSALPLSVGMADNLASLILNTLDQPDDEQARQDLGRQLIQQT